MKIYLGTTSKDKYIFLQKELLKYLGNDFSIFPHSVNSDVSDQPLTEKETLSGAINRAFNLKSLFSDADIYVGMEGGLTKLEDNKEDLFLVCAVCFLFKDGTVLKSVSSKLQLPLFMSQAILQGYQFGKMVREVKITESNLISSVYLNELLLREKAFTEAISNILWFMHKKIDR